MGLGKILKKALHTLTKPLEDLVTPKQPEMPEPAAAPVELPSDTEEAAVDDAAQTEGDRKKSQASGKKALSVARSSGGGINL